MIQRFLNYIRQNNLFKPTEKVLLAVSGGLDSVVMTHLFYSSQIPFTIAHCNFQLRGEDSVGDALFVNQLGEKYGVEVFSTSFDTLKYKKNNNVSTQMAARALRYDWFKVLTKDLNINVIATAHHANDQAETVLLNLTAGTGIRGLRGIKPKSNDIVRPLLFATRIELEAYAKLHQLTWREDSSNASIQYKRNAMRHLVVPELEKLNPRFVSTIDQFTDNMAMLEMLLHEQVEFWQKKVVNKAENIIYLDLNPLKELRYKSLILFELLKEYGFEETEEILRCSFSPSGKQFISKTHVLVVDRAQLVITPKETGEKINLSIDQNTTLIELFSTNMELETIESFNFENITKANDVAFLDYAKLTFPLILRNWKHGDTFQPIGMGGKSKKISDVLIDAKVPNNLKDKVLILESGNKIAWVVNFRMSEEFKVSDKILKVLKISYKK